MGRLHPQLAFAVGLAGLLAAPPAMAQNMAAPFGDCRLGYWSANRNLDDGAGVGKASCFVNWKHAFDERLRIHVGGRLGVRDSSSATGADARLREGFVEADLGPARVRIGRQIIAWGRADRINPTDNLSPRDFTALVPEDEEQRIGIDALAAQLSLGDEFDLVAVAVPRFEPHRLPQASLPHNRVVKPAPDSGERAVKLQKSGGAWDGSVSYYHGFDRYPRYSVAFPGTPTYVFAAEYPRMRTLGADFSTSIDGWGVRGEFAASRFSPDCGLRCDAQQDRRQERRLVLGVDRDIGDSANLNVQLFGIRRDRHRDLSMMPAGLQQIGLAVNRLNSQYDTEEYGFTLRISDRYLNDRLKAEVSAIGDISGHSAVVRPRVSYSVSDTVKVVAGADYLHGKDHSFFGSRRRNRLGFVELVTIF